MGIINLRRFFGASATSLVLVLLVFSTDVKAQTEFEKWKAEQGKEFQEYKNKFDQEFIEMLNKTWEEIGINLGNNAYKEEKPDDIPVFPPPPPKPKVENQRSGDNILEENIDDTNIEIDLEPIRLPPPPTPKKKIIKKTTHFGSVQTLPLTIPFFSDRLLVEYPNMVKTSLKPSDFSNGKIDNKSIAKFWDVVSSVNHEEFIKYTLDLKKEKGLNDWGYILLVNDLSKSIFSGSSKNLVRLMNWFILTKAGYEVKIGYDQNGVYNLFSVSNNIFNTKYYTLDGNKFFPINFNRETQNPGKIYTYSGKHKEQIRKLDLTIDSYPDFIATGKETVKNLTFDYDGKTYKLPVSINNEVVSYFEYYPLTDLGVFFTASFSDATKAQIYSALKPILEGKSELEAVSILLRFVQKAFDYKTDQDQFDREKYMMPDEALFYDYSDCDDRSIIFANLVRELLDLKVVGLRYSRHLAVAVAFNENVDGDYHMHLGDKFTVADPTFINAPVGLTMTSYKNEDPEIISIGD